MAKVTNQRKPAAKAASKRFPPLKLKPPSKTIEQLAREQGVKPITDWAELNALGQGFQDADMDGFEEFIKEERAKERQQSRKKRR